MKISSKPASGVSSASGAGGVDPSQEADIQSQLDQLQQYMQTIQTQQQTGVQQMDPTQLSQGIQNTLKALQGPSEAGQLSPQQNGQLQHALDTIGAMMQGQGTQNQQQPNTGYSMEDKYDAAKVGGHHGGGHHAHSTPPVDDADADSNTIQSNPTDA